MRLAQILMAFVLVGTSLDAIAQRQDLSPFIAEVRDKYKLPAMAVTVMQGGVVIGANVVGVRKVGESDPVTLEDEWHHGSLTKSMTATLAALLVDEGKIGWGTTLAEVFPHESEQMHPDWRGVTLEKLLGHRGGAPDWDVLFSSGIWKKLSSSTASPRDQRTLFRNLLTAMPPTFKPGLRFSYSNAGYLLAGSMLEARADQAWEDLMRDRIFSPLHMNSAGFGSPGVPGKLLQPWGHVWGGGDWRPVEPGARNDYPPGMGPAGTVRCSLADLALYTSAHLSGELGRPTDIKLKQDSWRRLHTALPDQNYGLGWFVFFKGWARGDVLQHTGSNLKWYSNVWVAPRRDFLVIVLTNAGGDTALKATGEVVEKIINKYY
ncbi:MAG: hypothetical protein RJA98_1459 [Pseudomonadota bacterium]